MDLQQRKQELLGQFIDHREAMDKLRKEIDEIDALEAAEYHKEMIGKCYIDVYGDKEEGINYFSISRVEHFDAQGHAKGTFISISNSGMHSIEFNRNIWHADKNHEDDGAESFPEAIFATIADELIRQIEVELKEFIKDLEGWKTKKRGLTLNFWTRIQQALSLAGLKSKPFETIE